MSESSPLYRHYSKGTTVKHVTGVIIMPWFYSLQKQKVCRLLLGKNTTFAHLTLILVTVTLNKFMSTGILALLLMVNLAGDNTLLPHVKQYQKLCICSHSCHSCGQPKRKLFYLTGASSVWEGCSDILFNKHDSLHTHTHTRARARGDIKNKNMTLRLFSYDV